MQLGMSALCQKRTDAVQQNGPLFDHLVGARKHGRRHSEAHRLGGFKIDHQLVPGRRLHRQVSWFLALENAIDVISRAPVLVDRTGPIGDQAATTDELAIGVDRGQSVLRRKGYD